MACSSPHRCPPGLVRRAALQSPHIGTRYEMTILRNALLATAALTLTASPALADHHGDKPVASAEQQTSEHNKMFALFADADQRDLALNPLNRLFRGDDTNATRLGDRKSTRLNSSH